MRWDSGSWASPRVMPSGPFVCAGHVEVAQRGAAQTVNPVEPVEHLFNQKLGLAVGVGRKQARIFLDGNRFRLAVDGGGGGEDQTAGAVGQDGLKQCEGGGGVVTKVLLGMEHGLAGLNEGGKVQDAVEGSSLGFGGGENPFQSGPVGQLSLNKFDSGG